MLQSPPSRLKAYTKEFGLQKSRIVRNTYDTEVLLIELASVATINKVYLTNGVSSTEIKFTQFPKKNRPVRYMRSDGIECRTVPISLNAYPVIVFYEDGSQSKINTISSQNI